MQTISVRIQHNSASKTGGQRTHDLRTGAVPDYVYQDKTYLNSVIIEPERSSDLRAECEQRRLTRDTQRSMKSNAAVATVGVITFSSEAQITVNALTPEAQDAMFARVVGAIAARLDTTISGLVVHRDEAAIHAHFQFPAYSRGGMPLSTIITKTVARELQDIAGGQVLELGITRGVSKNITGEEHKSVSDLHSTYAADMAAKREVMERAIGLEIQKQTAKLDKNQRLLREAERKIKDKEADEAKLADRMLHYEKRIADAKAELDAAQAKADALNLKVPPAPVSKMVTVITEEGSLFKSPKVQQMEVVSKQDMQKFVASVQGIEIAAAKEIQAANKKEADAIETIERFESNNKKYKDLVDLVATLPTAALAPIVDKNSDIKSKYNDKVRKETRELDRGTSKAPVLRM